MSVLFKQDRGQVQANLTPMIDVTFLLIVFFVLVSQIVEVENVDLDLPTPREPVAWSWIRPRTPWPSGSPRWTAGSACPVTPRKSVRPWLGTCANSGT